MSSGFRVEIAPAAERDIAEAFLWYRDRSVLVADAFRAEVFAALDRLEESPLGRSADAEGQRKRVLKRFPFSVVYALQGGTITILAVAHHRRKPGYWRPTKA